MTVIKPWVLFALLSALFAAATAILAKAGLRSVQSDLATAIRTVVILAIAWGIVFFKGYQRQIASIDNMAWLFLILSAVATGLSWLFYFRALQAGKASEVSVIDKGSLLFTILLAVIFLGETLSWKVIAGAVLMVIGMILVILP